MLDIAIINQSKNITKTEAKKAISSINRQLSEHFFPAWHIKAKCSLATKATSDQAVITIKDNPPDDTEGYHDKDLTGRPFGYVFFDISADLNEFWTVTLSHEVLELALNPLANAYAKGVHPKFKNRTVFFWLEACDAVQMQTYEISGISVSDFVLPVYFSPEREEGKNNSYLGTKVNSLAVAKGGYCGFFDPKTGKEETIFADELAKKRTRIKSRRGIYSRSALRKMSLT